MAEGESTDGRVTQETLTFYRQTLEWLIHHHEAFASTTQHDLAEDERHNAVWKLSGQAIAFARALVELLDRGYTGQTWALMRAIHEVDRLLVAVTDESEERIVRRRLANQEVKQKDAREAEQRQATRVSEQMAEAGHEPIGQDVAELSRQIYRVMSAAAHHQRVIVDEAIDHQNRTMIYGPDLRESEASATPHSRVCSYKRSCSSPATRLAFSGARRSTRSTLRRCSADSRRCSRRSTPTTWPSGSASPDPSAWLST